MSDCEFCKIAQKKHAAHIILEDVNFLAFLDKNPLTEGHTLVIPKNHYHTVWDMYGNSIYTHNFYKEYEIFCAKIANFLKKYYNQPVNSMVLEYEVKHACTHLVPNVHRGFGLVLGNFLKSKKGRILTIDEGNNLIEKYNTAVRRRIATFQ